MILHLYQQIKGGGNSVNTAKHKMKQLTIKAAKETTIYFLAAIGTYSPRTYTNEKTGRIVRLSDKFEVTDFEVKSDDLYSFIIASVEETTSPRGVEAKVFVDEITEMEDILSSDPEYIEAENEQKEVTKWAMKRWQPNGRAQIIERYNSEEEAEQDLFSRTYEYEFLTDDQRDTEYFTTIEEAQAAREERLKDL